MTRLRIAMVGSRGVPATWGGIEHHVEEVGARLARRGHEVVVFGRPGYVDRDVVRYRGVSIRHLRTVPTKHLDAFVHSGLATLDAMRGEFDVVHYHALGPGLFTPLCRLRRGGAVVQTIHGRDDERAKWGSLPQRMLRAGAWLSARVPDATIAVSETLLVDYARRYGSVLHHVPNGVRRMERRAPDLIGQRFGLEGRDYALFVGRLVPEKAPDVLVKAFRQMSTGMRLVIAGGSCFTDAYVERLHALAAGDPRIVFAGYVQGPLLEELYANAAVFVLPSELEGLPLTLLEGAAAGVPVVASAIPPHVEVVREDGPGHRLFPTGDADALQVTLEHVITHLDEECTGARKLRGEVLARYDWDAVADHTEACYRDALARARTRPNRR